jgi:hypothetical protein
MVLELFSITLIKGILSCNIKIIKTHDDGCCIVGQGLYSQGEKQDLLVGGTHGFLGKLTMVWLIMVEGLPIGAWHIKIGQEGICNLCTKSSLGTTKHGLI